MGVKDASGANAPRRLGGIARRLGFGGATREPAATGSSEAVARSEHTHFGAAADRIVARARANQRPRGEDHDYDVVRAEFDYYHYLFQAVELQDDPDADPIAHFLSGGDDAPYSPHPNFSLSKYLRRHPERRGSGRSAYALWLEEGRAAGELADPSDGVEAIAGLLGRTPAAVVDDVVALRDDTMARLRSGTLGEMYARAIEVEPLIGATWPATLAQSKQLPLRNDSVAQAARAIHEAHRAVEFTRPQVVVVVGRPRPGARGRTEAQLVASIATTIDPAGIVVLYTDKGGRLPEGRLPVGVREIDFASSLTAVGPRVREEALVSLLRSFRADAIVAVGSQLFIDVLKPFGKALAVSERLFVCFTSTEEQTMGHRVGQSLSWVYPIFDFVAGIFTESDALRTEIVEHYQIGEPDLARLHTLAAPEHYAQAARLLTAQEAVR